MRTFTQLLSQLLTPWLPAFALLIGLRGDTVPAVTMVRDQSVSVTREGRMMRGNQAVDARLLTLDASGHMLASEEIRDGWRDGRSQWWDSTGHLVEQRTYRHGDKIGTHTGWWSDGTPRFACTFTHGVRDGVCREWYEGGALATEQHYAHGQEDGPQRGWRRDGTLQFSYVRRNGRRYGLRGDVTCVISAEKERGAGS